MRHGPPRSRRPRPTCAQKICWVIFVATCPWSGWLPRRWRAGWPRAARTGANATPRSGKLLAKVRSILTWARRGRILKSLLKLQDWSSPVLRLIQLQPLPLPPLRPCDLVPVLRVEMPRVCQ
jgi:hypothetical protein